MFLIFKSKLQINHVVPYTALFLPDYNSCFTNLQTKPRKEQAFRSSRSEMFYKIGVLKTSKFTGKHHVGVT